MNFAHNCKRVVNVIKSNKYRNSIPASTPIVRKKEKKVELPWKAVEADVQMLKLSTNFGNIAIYKVGDDSWPEKTVCLHGYPS